MGNFTNFLRKICWDIFVFILFLVTLIIFPLIVCIVGIPIFIIRRVISSTSRFFRPDLGKMLSTRSTVFATDELYTSPKATLLVFLIAELSFDSIDQLDIPVILKNGREDLATRLINLRSPDGKHAHPELQQYISKWLGFYFWKYDTNFNIDNHIKQYDGNVKFENLDEDSIIEVSKELVSKPFIKGRSPWEFIGFPNVKFKGKYCQTKRPQGAIAFRLHHSLADGYSILKLLVADIGAHTKIDIVKPSLIQKSCMSEYINKITFCLRAPYEFVSQLAEAYDINDWHVPENKISTHINFSFTEKIPLTYIKEIKKRNGVTFTAVLFAAFTGAIRNFMLERGLKVPEAIHCVAPFPVPGHPDKLRNYMTAIFVRLPVGLEHPNKRIRTLEKHIKSLKNSTVPYTQFLLFPLMGGVFPCMSKYFFKQYYSTAILSSFPGPENKLGYDSHIVEDIFFNGGMLPGRIGISLTSLSYGKFIRIGAGFNEGVLPPNIPVKHFMELIIKELDVLYENGNDIV